MSNTSKPFSEYDQNQIFKKSYNPNADTLGVDGFVVGEVGRKITRTVISATVEDWSFYENGTSLLYTIRVTYDNAAHDNVDEVERTA